MRYLPLTAILIAATTGASPLAAQAPASPQSALSALLRRDADLRERIGRIQLDALVSRIDRTIDRRPHRDDRAGKDAALRHDLDLYTF